jgi:murein DD-endopeptidase MepM/ murein hydrolase activator NlpD
MRLHRRALLGAAAFAGLGLSTRQAAAGVAPAWGYPIARGAAAPGDGFFIKHGYGCENPTYYPGLTHTGENWYGLSENAAGADVIAVAAGEVVYTDYDYPGRVVIVRHEPELYSVYGHLDPDVTVGPGDRVERGDRLGTVLARSDEYARSHLHFEIRTFFTNDRVNGANPEHGFTCGLNCPPGPGYWPLNAPEHPTALGWRNPTHAIARCAFPDGLSGSDAHVVVSSAPFTPVTDLWSAPPWRAGAERTGELQLRPGEQYRLRQIAAGSDDSVGRDADAYGLWYRIESDPFPAAWVRAAVPSTLDRNTNGAPAAIVFDFFLDG